MKIVNRKEFLALPSGTYYMKYSPLYNEELHIKSDSTESDWYYTEVDFTAVECQEGTQYEEGTLFADCPDAGKIAIEFGWSSRDGLFDEDQKFLVFETWEEEILKKNYKKILGV